MFNIGIFELSDVFTYPSMPFVFNLIGKCLMRIDIRAMGIMLTSSLREYIERRLHFALGWASHGVYKIVVHLSDINGPRGGKYKYCLIQIPFPRAPDVLIENMESDLYVAIDRAAHRAERALARQRDRLRESGHDRIHSDEPTGAKRRTERRSNVQFLLKKSP
jgi:putative sigma-54 modulation protein